MKTFSSECNDKTSSLNGNNNNDKIYRILTLSDIHQALNTLEMTSNSSMLPGQNNQIKHECPCCHLVRSDQSSRLLLPLARRGRPYLSTRSPRLLCRTCLKIKRKQQDDILQNLHQSNERDSKNIFDTMHALDQSSEDEIKPQMIVHDIPDAIEFSLINQNEKIHLNNSEYDPTQMLVWKINTSDNHNQTNSIETSYDTGTLKDNEKKILLQEAVQKLQIVLNNRPTSTTTTIPDSDLDKIEFTYRALQTTVNILSSSLDSL